METRTYAGGGTRIRIERNDDAQKFALNIEYDKAPEMNGTLNISMRFYPTWADVERFINTVRF